MSQPTAIRPSGRILFLTRDPELLQRQLAGEDLPWDPEQPLMDNISTDEIAPAWACFHYDETLGRYTMVGLRGGHVQPDAIRDGGFEVLVAGESMGCGSSREQAPYGQLAAGVKLVIAHSIEKIYQQNCQNIGLLTSTDLSLVARIRRGEAIALDELTEGLDPISADIVRSGGLFEYNRRRLRGELSPPVLTTPRRPMTMVEKIVASHAVRDAERGDVGVEAVAPGDALFVRTDVRFSHEYVTPMAEALFKQALGQDAALADPASVYAFRDHLTFLGEVMPEEKRKAGLLKKATHLAEAQTDFAHRHQLTLYGERDDGGSEAICHNAIVEEVALPGMVVTGTDSHTCMAGVLGAFAFGVGATDMANAWLTRDVRVRVPETVRFALRGRLAPGVAAKDVMLHLLALPFFRTSQGIGKVLEYGGDGVSELALDERATLANMSVEAGGFTGIVEPDERLADSLSEVRGIDRDDVLQRIVRSDVDASYFEQFDLDLASVEPMVATPGDPRNGVAVASLTDEVPIDIAYGGSCTGGKKTDMDMYATVFEAALRQGRRVAPGVRCYIQFGSQRIRRYAEQRGYLRIFEQVGASVIQPSCGACINAGPGASRREDEVTVSAQNRNFPGRSGPGRVYLASPLTVAASAVAGRIVSPHEVRAGHDAAE